MSAGNLKRLHLLLDQCKLTYKRRSLKKERPMGRDIEKKGRNEINRNRPNHDIEVLNPVPKSSPFISFHYSYKEISSVGGKTHIRSKEKSFENGKFKSEEFEGTLDGNVYFKMVGEMQRFFFNQIATFLKPLSVLLPSKTRNKRR